MNIGKELNLCIKHQLGKEELKKIKGELVISIAFKEEDWLIKIIKEMIWENNK